MVTERQRQVAAGHGTAESVVWWWSRCVVGVVMSVYCRTEEV